MVVLVVVLSCEHDDSTVVLMVRTVAWVPAGFSVRRARVIGWRCPSRWRSASSPPHVGKFGYTVRPCHRFRQWHRALAFRVLSIYSSSRQLDCVERGARVGSITTQLLLRATRTFIARPPVIWLTVPVLAPARLRAYRLCSILQVGLGCDDQTLHTARPLNEMWPQISDLLGIRGRVSVRPSLLPTLDAGIASVLSFHVAC